MDILQLDKNYHFSATGSYIVASSSTDNGYLNRGNYNSSFSSGVSGASGMSQAPKLSSVTSESSSSEEDSMKKRVNITANGGGNGAPKMGIKVTNVTVGVKQESKENGASYGKLSLPLILFEAQTVHLISLHLSFGM